MLLKDYDWKVGDRVIAIRGRDGAEFTGVIIGVGLSRRGTGLSYTIKISDRESFAASSRNMRLCK